MAVCFGSLLLVLLGIVSVFGKDMMWEFTVWQNQMKGIASERTENWEIMTTVSGVILLIVGGLGIYLSFVNGG